LTDNQHICKISATFMQIFCRYCRPCCSYAAVLQQICDRYLQTFYIYVSFGKGIFSLLFRYFNICSSYQIFHAEKFKKLLLQNGYPKFFIDRCVKTFLDKMISPPLKVQNAYGFKITYSDCFTLYGESCYSDPSTITQIVFLGSSTTTCDF
jgi:hypothetical protein